AIDETDVGRGASRVDGEHPLISGEPGEIAGPKSSGRGSGQQRRDGLPRNLPGREHAAVGLHDEEGKGTCSWFLVSGFWFLVKRTWRETRRRGIRAVEP